jgi:hypothetical protein
VCCGKTIALSIKLSFIAGTWWNTSVIPGLRRQEDHEFKASLGYIASSRPLQLHMETVSERGRRGRGGKGRWRRRPTLKKKRSGGSNRGGYTIKVCMHRNITNPPVPHKK